MTKEQSSPTQNADASAVEHTQPVVREPVHGPSYTAWHPLLAQVLIRVLGKAVHNFSRTLPEPQSDLAAQTLKDPYLFDFLELSGDVDERRLERGLVEKLRSFLLELGKAPSKQNPRLDG